MSSRLARIRDGLTPAEWARAGVMVGIVAGLNVLGWVMLAAAVSGHYHISKTQLFGFGTGVLAYTLGMRHAF
ncbi:MAG: HoxN/HupN/NixA family nickel/cobalt transporter, partial [Actinobacteria bacterium]|nr:HoxN/HupN/NixA family nickel/cobalt transporter [Actinomycetota bacterium]